jgi:lysophospholipase L1-like esterase
MVPLSLVVTLLALEVAARVYAGLTSSERGMAFDPELGWRPLPNVKKVGGLWGVSRPASTNSHGWRDRERPYEKPAGVRRAVAIGDSFTFGADVDDGERFTDVLGRLVPGLDVVNLGVAGYGTDQQLRVLEMEAFRYQPDVLVLTVCVLNDLDDIGYERLYSFPKPTYTLEGGQLVLRRPPYTWDLRLRNSSYLVETLVQRLMNEDQRPRRREGFRPADAEALFGALVRRIQAIAADHHVPLVAVIAYAPTDAHPDYHGQSRVITRALADAGIPHLDVHDLFARRSANPDLELFAPVGRHWNPTGHALVADGLRDLIATVGVR